MSEFIFDDVEKARTFGLLNNDFNLVAKFEIVRISHWLVRLIRFCFGRKANIEVSSI